MQTSPKSQWQRQQKAAMKKKLAGESAAQ